MAKKQNCLVKFTSEAKFGVSKISDAPAERYYDGHVFSTCYNGVGYNWRICIKKSTDGYYEQFFCFLELLGGSSSKVCANFSLKASFNVQSLKRYDRSSHDDQVLFTSNCREIGCVLEVPIDVFHDTVIRGFVKVVAEIKMNKRFFDPFKLIHELKQGITEDQEKISAVSSEFFELIDEEPSGWISLKLVVGPEKTVFHCNPQILEQNSAYFANMLHASPEFKENKESKINLPELNPEGVRAALCYLYTKKLPENFKEVAQVCLPAAHLFLLPGLVLECEKVLIGELSAENDVDMVIVANTYKLTLLKHMALNSIAVHIDDVMKNAETKKKLKSVNLVGELFELVAGRVRCGPGVILL